MPMFIGDTVDGVDIRRGLVEMSSSVRAFPLVEPWSFTGDLITFGIAKLIATIWNNQIPDLVEIII
jgi:hypothetical protein